MQQLKTKSFTLIELLITLFIIALLTAVSIPAIRQFQRRADLKMTASEIRSAILEAKSYSLAPRIGGTKIQSYAVVFYGPTYGVITIEQAKRNSYEILENQNGIDFVVPGSIRKLPKDTNFLNFNWDDSPLDSLAEIRFGVVEQGGITNVWGESASPVFEAVIKIHRQSEKCWRVKVIKATAGISIEEQGGELC